MKDYKIRYGAIMLLPNGNHQRANDIALVAESEREAMKKGLLVAKQVFPERLTSKQLNPKNYGTRAFTWSGHYCYVVEE